MREKAGDVFYYVYWDLGFDQDHDVWDETCGPDDVEKPEFELWTYRVRSVRKWRKAVSRATVTAYHMVEGLTVDRKGEWLQHPDKMCKRQWLEGDRPASMRPTKHGAYVAALAAIRKDDDFNIKKHADFVGRLKAQRTKARKAA